MPVDGTIKLRIKTRERRYILKDDSALVAALMERGAPLEYVPGRQVTEITTIYFDTAEGTWVNGKSKFKIRTRNYQDPEYWWLEVKRREVDRVDKWRRPLKASILIDMLKGKRGWKSLTKHAKRQPLRPIFGVRCHRTSWEWPNLRVTLDRGLAFYDVDKADPLTIGKKRGWLNGIVAEVKCAGKPPAWLASVVEKDEVKRFSKSRYALALLAGHRRPFLKRVRKSKAKPKSERTNGVVELHDTELTLT